MDNNQSLQESTKANKMKQMIYTNINAVVRETPIPKIIKQQDGSMLELYKTYVELQTDYRPFCVDVYTKDKPEVTVGEIITVQISTGNYNLRMQKNNA